MTFRGVSTPGLRLPEYFRLRDDLPDLDLSIVLEQADSGWATATIEVGDQNVIIELSDAFPPFEAWIQWLKFLERDGAAAFEIDEEGTIKRLDAHETNDETKVYFLVKDKYEDTIYLHAILDRRRLIDTFSEKLYSFFLNDFSPERWDGCEGGRAEKMRCEILGEPWFKANQPK